MFEGTLQINSLNDKQARKDREKHREKHRQKNLVQTHKETDECINGHCKKLPQNKPLEEQINKDRQNHRQESTVHIDTIINKHSYIESQKPMDQKIAFIQNYLETPKLSNKQSKTDIYKGRHKQTTKEKHRNRKNLVIEKTDTYVPKS